MRLVGNMLDLGYDDLTQLIIDCNLMISLSYVIDHENSLVQRTALWITGNLLADRPKYIQLSIDSGLIFCALEIVLMYNDNFVSEKQNQDRLGVLNEAIWALACVTLNGQADQLLHLIDNDLLQAFCMTMNMPNNFDMWVPLKGIENLLQAQQEGL